MAWLDANGSLAGDEAVNRRGRGAGRRGCAPQLRNSRKTVDVARSYATTTPYNPIEMNRPKVLVLAALLCVAPLPRFGSSLGGAPAGTLAILQAELQRNFQV